MANKFQKSVLERLEQESSRQKAENRQRFKENELEIDERVAENVPVPVAQSNKDSKSVGRFVDTSKEHPSDISYFLRPTLQRQAKNKTFYLDGDVISAVKSTARSQKVTDSKLVNDILRRVLGLDE